MWLRQVICRLEAVSQNDCEEAQAMARCKAQNMSEYWGDGFRIAVMRGYGAVINCRPEYQKRCSRSEHKSDGPGRCIAEVEGLQYWPAALAC